MGRAKLEVLFLFLFVLLSNKWMQWEEGIRYVQADDSRSYLKMALAAPALPDSPPNFHHAQRIFIHYVVGSTAKLTGLDLGTLYETTVVILSLLVALLAHELLLHLDLAPFLRRLLLSAFLLSPYVFRYYWIAPTMLADILFVLGLGVLLWGLMQVRLSAVYAGCIIALLGRQNIILTLPGIAVWMAMVPAWRTSSFLKRMAHFSALAIVVLGLFIASGKLVASFALPMENGVGTFVSFFVWLASPDYSSRMLVEHLLRVALPEILIFALMLAFLATRPKNLWAKVPLEFFASLVIALGLFSQPLVVNPLDLGQNQSRQAAIGLLALMLAAGYLFKLRPLESFAKTPSTIAFLRTGIVLSSFHHMYTVIGPRNVMSYTILQLASCVIAGISFYFLLTGNTEREQLS